MYNTNPLEASYDWSAAEEADTYTNRWRKESVNTSHLLHVRESGTFIELFWDLLNFLRSFRLVQQLGPHALEEYQ